MGELNLPERKTLVCEKQSQGLLWINM